MDLQGQNGLLSTYRESYRARGPLAFVIAAALVGFYTVLYWEEKLSGALGGHPLTALAEALHLRNRWYLYGFLYCVAMSAGGVYYLRRHGNSRYNRARIAVNVGVQVVLGFTLPFVMPLFGQPEFYFSYFWPLKYDYLYPQTLVQLPVYLSVYAVLGGLVAAPVLAFFFGKRWYCSWVCGCGGLANTFGDPYRHLTSKSSAAWRFERWSIHTVLGAGHRHHRAGGGRLLLGRQSPGPAPRGGGRPRVGEGAVRLRGGLHLGGGDRHRPLPTAGPALVVPQLLPHGRAAGAHPEAGALPHHGEARHVHLVRQLQHLL
jgi:hypothetical protein